MYRVLLFVLSSSILLAGCSPSLNWREVRVGNGELKTLLPCKPDQGSRRQDLAGLELEVRMAGCEAGGALFAVSSAELGDPGRALAVQVQWQASLLGNMQAGTASTTAFAIKGATAPLEPVQLTAQGVDPGGRKVMAQGVWFARGTRLYHAVIYAERISTEMSEPFFTGLELQ